MLTEDNPTFDSWDQDATAVSSRYDAADPEQVADELEAAAQAFVARLAAVDGDQRDRRGSRSDGAAFTVATFSQYFLHDVVHHLWDVTGQQDATTSLQLETLTGRVRRGQVGAAALFQVVQLRQRLVQIGRLASRPVRRRWMSASRYSSWPDSPGNSSYRPMTWAISSRVKPSRLPRRMSCSRTRSRSWKIRVLPRRSGAISPRSS